MSHQAMRQQGRTGERYQFIQMDRPRNCLVMSMLPGHVDKILECPTKGYRHGLPGQTQYICKTSQCSVCARILANGSDVQCRDKRNTNPIGIACWYGRGRLPCERAELVGLNP